MARFAMSKHTLRSLALKLAESLLVEYVAGYIAHCTARKVEVAGGP